MDREWIRHNDEKGVGDESRRRKESRFFSKHERSKP